MLNEFKCEGWIHEPRSGWTGEGSDGRSDGRSVGQTDQQSDGGISVLARKGVGPQVQVHISSDSTLVGGEKVGAFQVGLDSTFVRAKGPGPILGDSFEEAIGFSTF